MGLLDIPVLPGDNGHADGDIGAALLNIASLGVGEDDLLAPVMVEVCTFGAFQMISL